MSRLASAAALKAVVVAPNAVVGAMKALVAAQGAAPGHQWAPSGAALVAHQQAPQQDAGAAPVAVVALSIPPVDPIMGTVSFPPAALVTRGVAHAAAGGSPATAARPPV